MARPLTPTVLVFLALAIALRGALAQEQQSESQEEKQARLARRGAGLLAGTWSTIALAAPSGTMVSSTPWFEGYFRRGLDQHLAFETSVGFWQHVMQTPASGGLGGSAAAKTSVYLVPQLTSIRLYPFTRAGDAVEPFVSGGLGLTLGIQDNAGGGGVLGGGGGTGMIAGIGAGASGGVEWRFSAAFGVVAAAHYTYIQFFDDLAGNRLYRGLGLKGGLTYRFQY